MMKKILSLFVLLMVVTIGARAGDVNATLDHTAGAQWGSNTGASTVDAEKEHYNNDAANAWAGCAYAKFTFSIPEGHSISKATLTYSVNQGGKSGRNDIIYYMSKEFDLDWANFAGQTGIDLRNAGSRAGKAVAAAATGGTGDRIGLSQDVTAAVKAIYEGGQNYIIFQWTGNAGGADLYGKGSENAPALVITTTDEVLYEATFNANDGTLSPTVTVYSDADRKTAVAKNTLLANTTYYFTATLTGYKDYNGDFTVETSNPTVNFTMTAKNVFNYTVNGVDGSDNPLGQVNSGSGFEGETITYYYPQFILSGTTLFVKNKNGGNPYWGASGTLDANNKEFSVKYGDETIENVVFYKEAEDIEGFTAKTTNNAPIRCSNGTGGVVAEETALTTLAPGKYKIYGQVWGTTGVTAGVKAGEKELWSLESTGSLVNSTSDEFEITESTDLTVYTTGGNDNHMLDLLYIVKTGDYVPVVTSYTVTIAEGIEGGTVAADPTSANAGAEVTLTNTPAEGYEFVSYSVTCKTNNEAVTVTDGKFTMPADDVTVSATFAKVYTVTISNEIENGTVVADPTSAKAGDEVTLTNTPAEGYEFVSYSVTCKTNNEAVIVTDGKFTMPADDVTVSATFQLPAPATYAVTISDEIENGTVAVNPTTAKAGEEVTITATPAEGYELVSVSVTGVTSNEAVIVTDGKFTMPADAVTVNAKFQQKATPTIYIETDLTAKFNSLATTQWTGSSGQVGWAAPKVKTNSGLEVAAWERYNESCDWTGDIMSSSVTGLVPGTYKIELYGAAAFTFGRKFGSMAFTGDFSKDTSDTYKENESIDENTGVTLYAETAEGKVSKEIPIWYATNFNTSGIATATLENVIVGESGEIKIGLSKTSTSTNWHVVQLKGVTAQVPAADALADAVATAKAVEENSIPAKAYSALQAVVTENDKVFNTAEEYQAAIAAINEATATANTFVAPYAEWKKVAPIATKVGVELPDISEMTAEELAAAAKNLYVEMYNYTTTKLADDSKLLGDWTDAPGTNKGESWDGTAEDTYYDAWNKDPFAMTQTVVLPAGKYVLMLKARASAGAGIDMTDGTTTIDMPKNGSEGLGIQTDGTPSYSSNGVFANNNKGRGWEYRFLPFASDGTTATTLTINWDTRNAQWIGVDDIQLYGPQFYNINIAEGIENGTVAADPTSAKAGDEVTLTNTPAEGYEFVSYSVTGKTIDEAVIVTDGKFTMPADDVTVSATFAKVYAVTISNEIENGTVVADPTSAKEGDEVTLTNTPAEGYEFVSYSVTGKTIDEAVIVTDGKFTMPADDVTVNATFAKVYAVKIAIGMQNGTVEGPASAAAEEKVILKVTPAEGYELETLTIKCEESQNEINYDVVDYSFTMPSEPVNIVATFKEKSVDPSGDEEIALAADMFYTWDGYGADASKIASATVDFKVGESVDQGATVVGTGSVDYLTYADMTGSTKVIFEGTNGTEIRLLMNRQESNDGPLVEKNATIADGKAEISLTDLDFVHVNAIKIPWNGSTGNIISAITFVKPNDPLAGPKEALKDAIAEAKKQNSVAKTEESFAALTKAISDGEAALADAQATAESLTTAKSDIETAVKGLTLAEGYAEVTKEMFKQYASVDEPGEGTATTGAYELFTASDLPYGDGSVSELKWADLTKYDKLIVTVAGTTAPRLCMNRLVKDGQQAATQEDSKMLDINPNNGNTWSTEKYQTVADGVYTIDLAAIVKDYSFARLHCIKKQGWGAGVVVTGMYLHEAPVTYDITVADGIENGTVTVDPTTAKAGDEVTITATPAEGYELASISVTGQTSNLAVEVTDGKFTMPADDVTVGATFKFAPVDKTDLITNWDFTGCENNNFPGWTIYNPNGGNAWKNGTSNVEYWIGTAANGVFDYYQDIDAPDGVYTLTANMWNSTNGVATDAVNGNAGVYGTSSGVTVFAGVTDDCDNANLHQYTTEPIKVLDGKLRLGVKNNGVMGARWFGVDWIKLTQIGKVQALDYEAGHTEALNAAKATLSAEENAIVVGEERTALEAAIEKNSEVAEQTVEAYKAAIKALQTASNDFTAARAGYAALASTKETLLGYAEKYVYASAEKTAAVTAAAEAAPTSAADATSKNVNLINALRAMAESHAKAEGVEGAEAIAITNPSAEDNTNGWTTVKGEGSGGSIGVLSNEPWTSADGSTAHKYFDGGDWGASAWDVSLTQNVELAAGKYMLSAISRASGDVALTIFAGENKTTMPSIGAAGGIFDRGWNISSVEFEVNANSTVTIGVQGVTSVIHNWMSFSDFKLVLIESYAVKVAKAELLEAINEAKAIDTEGKNGAKELATAITVAEGVYNNDEATLEGVNTAKSDLAAAVAAFDEANKVYAVNVDAEIENGTVAVNPTSAKAGDEVTITATPAEGYELASITVTGVASEEIVEVTDGKFTMPADDVTVTATFVLATGIDAAPADKSIKADGKYFKNGKLIIIKNGKEYNAAGVAK